LNFIVYQCASLDPKTTLVYASNHKNRKHDDNHIRMK